METKNFVTGSVNRYYTVDEKEEHPLLHWMHNHPITIKMGEIGLATLGLYTFSGGVRNLNARKAAVGLASTGVAFLAHQTLGLIAPPKKFIEQIFTPGECKAVTLAYEGEAELPVLTILTKDPYKAGYGRGWLLADQIYEIRNTSAFALHTLKKMPNHTELKETIEAVRKWIPKDYLTEMEAFVEGYNDKREEWEFLKGLPLTIEEVILWHLVPERQHLEYREMEKSLDREEVACTIVVDGDESSGPIFGRNLDWPTLGIYGTYTLLIRRVNLDNTKTIELGLPNLCSGVLSAMNSHGFCVAMNVCRGLTDYVNGIPAVFYNRLCLESCKTVIDAKSFVEKNKPLGPYHLSVADTENAMSIHLYQNEGKHFFRKWNKEKPLITTNFRYGPLGKTLPTSSNSEGREIVLEKYFQSLNEIENKEEINKLKDVTEALMICPVNNMKTLHTLVMHLKDRKMSVAFDNGWAASNLLAEAPTKDWFN